MTVIPDAVEDVPRKAWSIRSGGQRVRVIDPEWAARRRAELRQIEAEQCRLRSLRRAVVGETNRIRKTPLRFIAVLGDTPEAFAAAAYWSRRRFGKSYTVIAKTMGRSGHSTARTAAMLWPAKRATAGRYLTEIVGR